MKKTINVLFFNFPKTSSYRTKILDKIQLEYNVNVFDSDNQEEAVQILTQKPKTVFVFNAHTTAEYMRCRTILSNYKEFHKKNLYSICFLETVNREISQSLKALGCRRIFDQSAKAIDVANTISSTVNFEEPQREFVVPKSELAIEVKSKSDKVLKCSLDSLDEDNLLIELQGSEEFSPGERIKLKVVFEYENCKINIDIDGLIENIERTEFEDISMLNMNISEDEVMSLENFLVLFAKKQQKIHEFMELAKGA